ncbi:uncharacterized protein Tco025E_04295 [Trypanosoma conorhini]|uniref:Uncharacterized protein n=1 Tax=Trypanosoma conorhini TaxID=83891 RepID=A0A3R7L3W2_9TRYP|nr:uncharacterized protein Tco025E_04295 [Trypanosoma conorhini]RNF19162.1 hypothetical protein Tco025E_04295 [Trypanosoma conorhini]
MISERDWRVVGTYRWRSVSQLHANSEEACLYDDARPLESIPVIFYDTRQEDGEILAPRYVARKVSVPQGSSQKVKVVSGCARPQDTTPVVPLDPCLNCGAAATASGSRRRPEKSPLVVGTTLPLPLHTIFFLPITLLLADIAVTAAGMTRTTTGAPVTVVCCLVALGPDVIAIALILKRNSSFTFLAVHVVLWPCFVFLFLLPFLSMLFIIHVIISVILLLFIVRFRLSTYTTFFTFQ